MLIIIGLSSPLDNFSGIILWASIPFLVRKRMMKSKATKTSKTRNKIHEAWYKAGKIKAKQNAAITPISE